MNKMQEYTDTFNQFKQEQKRFHVDGQLEDILKKLHYYETALHRLAETACNREVTSHEEKRDASITAKVQAIAEELGFKVKFNGDPRGGAIRFILPSGKSNNWDGTTWGIYW
jgi:hypothetical protein